MKFFKNLLIIVIMMGFALRAYPVSVQKVKITGGDENYTATVDSVGRMSVNANVTFPEAVYSSNYLLNGSSNSMNVNGSSVNQNFQYAPPSGQTWYIEKISFYISDNASFAENNFGDVNGPLTNGMLFTYKTKNVVSTLTNLTSNVGIFSTFNGDSVNQVDSGLFGTSRVFVGDMRLQQRIVLDGTLGDYFRVTIRDNLSGLTNLKIKILIWRAN